MTMRATHPRVYIDRHGRRIERMSFARRAELRRRYIAGNPQWRHPLFGYLLAPFIVALGMVSTLFMEKALGTLHFPGVLLILAILTSAIFWGAGPALVCVALSTALLDYYFIPPIGALFDGDWNTIAQLLPFMVVGLSIALITSQREQARIKALSAEQELQVYAEEMEVTNKKLQEADQVKDKFLSIASHELKTPVTSIRGHAQLVMRRLARQKNLSPEMEEMSITLKKINDQTTRLTVLIDELLDVSSIQAGKIELRKQNCDLREICNAVVEDQRLLSGRTITQELTSEPIIMQVDNERIAQVFTNLIGNALKYSPEESEVVVSVEKLDSVACVRIIDHGEGISRDQQERIFDTFYRTPDAQSSSQRGLGLGLAISKDIIERHNGRIWCESEPGKGSVFFVEVPLC